MRIAYHNYKLQGRQSKLDFPPKTTPNWWNFSHFWAQNYRKKKILHLVDNPLARILRQLIPPIGRLHPRVAPVLRRPPIVPIHGRSPVFDREGTLTTTTTTTPWTDSQDEKDWNFFFCCCRVAEKTHPELNWVGEDEKSEQHTLELVVILMPVIKALTIINNLIVPFFYYFSQENDNNFYIKSDR